MTIKCAIVFDSCMFVPSWTVRIPNHAQKYSSYCWINVTTLERNLSLAKSFKCSQQATTDHSCWVHKLTETMVLHHPNLLSYPLSLPPKPMTLSIPMNMHITFYTCNAMRSCWTWLYLQHSCWNRHCRSVLYLKQLKEV